MVWLLAHTDLLPEPGQALATKLFLNRYCNRIDNETMVRERRQHVYGCFDTGADFEHVCVWLWL